MTQNLSSALSAKVGRKKEYAERITLPLTTDMLAGIDARLTEGEARLDMIRVAIAREIKRREKAN